MKHKLLKILGSAVWEMMIIFNKSSQKAVGKFETRKKTKNFHLILKKDWISPDYIPKKENRPTYGEAITDLITVLNHQGTPIHAPDNLHDAFRLKISANDLNDKGWRTNLDEDIFQVVINSLNHVNRFNENEELEKYVYKVERDYEGYMLTMEVFCTKIRKFIDGNQPYNDLIPFKIQNKKEHQPLFTEEHMVERVRSMKVRRDIHRNKIISMLKQLIPLKEEMEKNYQKAKQFFKLDSFSVKDVKKHVDDSLKSAQAYTDELQVVLKELKDYTENYEEWINEEWIKEKLTMPEINNAVEEASAPRNTIITLFSTAQSKPAPREENLRKIGQSINNQKISFPRRVMNKIKGAIF